MSARIVEHVSGVWSYHLAHEGSYKALCGRDSMMNTEMPLDHWGKECGNESIHFKWCGECAKAANICPNPTCNQYDAEVWNCNGCGAERCDACGDGGLCDSCDVEAMLEQEDDDQ